MSAEPFEIRVEPAVLDDLHARLQRTRWPPFRLAPDWDAGTSTAYLQELVNYWRTSYDWRRHEARLNAFPNFIAPVGQARVHFVHARGRGSRPMPLLLLHGWPDSFYRYHKVIPLLADPSGAEGDGTGSFDVVIPSLPGFAFTGPVRLGEHQPTRASASILWRLMTGVLGYERFAVAGGDGGSVLAQILAIDHPESVVAIHLTDLGWHASGVDPGSLSKPERKYLDAARKTFMSDGAYAVVQSSKPRSLTPALDDSPAGLASWIVDRFHSWADSPDDFERSFSKDDLLTNVMLYWVTRTIASSTFAYHADARSPSLTPADRVARPVALALFPRDVGGVPPRALAERTLNVQRWTEMPRGGHFAALEVPNLYARDVSEFFHSADALAGALPSTRTRDAHTAL
jgi:pimeloyl-ACP methyl ester carboxylesterase